jgi:hypothetical protein
MAFRTEERTSCLRSFTQRRKGAKKFRFLFAALRLGAIWLVASLIYGQQLEYEVRHDHLWKHGAGTLVVTERGVSFQEVTKKKQPKRAFELNYQDIQELKMSADKLTLVTYKDRKWLLGLDKEYEFTLAPGQSFSSAYALLKDRLDQRFVASVADEQIQALWEVPVKLLARVTGSEGILQVGPDRIVYRTTQKRQSRTWRYGDIENISTSGPFQLTLTTYERAKTHYGNLKGFNFQLKQALDEKQFNLLWRRLNQIKGLELLSAAQERENKP